MLLYGFETWVMGRRDRDRIEDFEIWVWKRIGKIKWIDRMGNEEILIKLKERNAFKYNPKVEGKRIEHVVRGNGILTVLECTVKRKKVNGEKS